MDKIENKITEHDHSVKYITTQEFNRLTADYFAARLKQANLGSKNDIADFENKILMKNKKITLKKLL